MTRLLALFATLAATAGCGTGEPFLEVGGGLLAYQEFGADAELVMGNQGGWHLDIATRFHHIDAIDLELIIVGLDPETEEQITLTVDRFLQERHTDESDGLRVRAGDRLIFDIADPSEVTGREVLVRATGTSADGLVAEGEASVVVVDREP